MRQIRFAGLTGTACILAALAAATAADAARKSTGTVTACSTYGRGCITAPTRMTELGPQVRSKGGHWMWCEVDCHDTLRRATIDFWDDQRERSK